MSGFAFWGCLLPEKKILVVDDDESLVRALAIKLRDAGYSVLAAWDAAQAVSQAQRHEPDLILLDIRMPEGGGFTVLETLKHSIKTRNIPVIVVTALEGQEISEAAKTHGAIEFFKKPLDTARLLEVIGKALAVDPAE